MLIPNLFKVYIFYFFAIAPSSPPVIICGNDTTQCPFEIIGSKRNITIYFQVIEYYEVMERE